MGKFIDLTGQQINDWTVIERGTNRKKSTMWKCRCKCGRIYNVGRGDLLSEQSKSCQHCGNTKTPDLIGQHFGKWTVLHCDLNRKSCYQYFICQCVCGNKKSVTSYNLRNNISTQCVCCAHKKGGYKDITGTYICNIRTHAYRRKIKFDITPKDLYKIWIQQNKTCALTGLPLTIAINGKNIPTIQTASVDRIDNNLGYIKNNVWFVHKTINRIKNTISINMLIFFANMISNPIVHNKPYHSIYCKHNKNWAGYGNISNSLWNGYTNNINRKSKTLELNLTIKDVWGKFQQQQGYCALTGLPLEFYTPYEYRCHNKIKTASLDRIDSNLGYIPNNVQWIHKTVNKFKTDLPQNEFIQWCNLISQYNKD